MGLEHAWGRAVMPFADRLGRAAEGAAGQAGRPGVAGYAPTRYADVLRLEARRPDATARAASEDGGRILAHTLAELEVDVPALDFRGLELDPELSLVPGAVSLSPAEAPMAAARMLQTAARQQRGAWSLSEDETFAAAARLVRMPELATEHVTRLAALMERTVALHEAQAAARGALERRVGGIRRWFVDATAERARLARSLADETAELVRDFQLAIGAIAVDDPALAAGRAAGASPRAKAMAAMAALEGAGTAEAKAAGIERLVAATSDPAALTLTLRRTQKLAREYRSGWIARVGNRPGPGDSQAGSRLDAVADRIARKLFEQVPRTGRTALERARDQLRVIDATTLRETCGDLLERAIVTTRDPQALALLAERARAEAHRQWMDPASVERFSGLADLAAGRQVEAL